MSSNQFKPIWMNFWPHLNRFFANTAKKNMLFEKIIEFFLFLEFKKMILIDQILSSKICNDIIKNYHCKSDIGQKLM